MASTRTPIKPAPVKPNVMELTLYQLIILAVVFVGVLFGVYQASLTVKEALLVTGVAIVFAVVNAAFHFIGGYVGIVHSRAFLELLFQTDPAIRDPTIPMAYFGIGYCLGNMLKLAVLKLSMSSIGIWRGRGG
jgi:hypothetical protein